MTVDLKIIENHLNQGCELIPVVFDDKENKKPRDMGWQDRHYVIDDLKDCYAVGIKTGIKSHVVVYDYDDLTLLPHFEKFKDRTYMVKTFRGFHIYILVKDSILPNRSLSNNKNQHIDIQSNGKMIVCESSDHPKGGKYELLSKDRKINEINPRELNDINESLGFGKIQGRTNASIIAEKLIKKEYSKGKGENRQGDLISYLTSLKMERPEFDRDDLFYHAESLQKHFKDKYDDETLWQKVDIAIEYAAINTIKNENGMIDKDKTIFERGEWTKVADKIENEHNFITIKENLDIWCYNKLKGVYEPNGDKDIMIQVGKLIPLCKREDVKEIIARIQRNREMVKTVDLLDSKISNTQNGIFDPDTFELKPHSPEYLTTTKLPFSINLQANNLKLWNHILTIIDPHDINLIMELIWICITWNNPFKKMFVFKGETNTQKTTLADIIAWIIGGENVARQKPEAFLTKDTRFGTSKFIYKRINIASEIGNLNSYELENLKALVGAELQNTERKSDNTERYFDPTKFVFLFTTNKLGSIYKSFDDNSIITRFQFLIFRNKIPTELANGQWYDSFFVNTDDKQSAIDTIINIVIHYKQAQKMNKIPKTKWSGIERTKEILKEEMPLDEKYFDDDRIIRHDGSKLTLEEVKVDFERFVRYEIKEIKLGYLMRRNGFKSSQSNSKTIYKNCSFSQGPTTEQQKQTKLEVEKQ